MAEYIERSASCESALRGLQSTHRLKGDIKLCS